MYDQPVDEENKEDEHKAETSTTPQQQQDMEDMEKRDENMVDGDNNNMSCAIPIPPICHVYIRDSCRRHRSKHRRWIHHSYSTTRGEVFAKAPLCSE